LTNFVTNGWLIKKSRPNIHKHTGREKVLPKGNEAPIPWKVQHKGKKRGIKNTQTEAALLGEEKMERHTKKACPHPRRRSPASPMLPSEGGGFPGGPPPWKGRAKEGTKIQGRKDGRKKKKIGKKGD